MRKASLSTLITHTGLAASVSFSIQELSLFFGSFLQFDSAIKVAEKNLYLHVTLLATTENEGSLQRLLVSLQGWFHFYINQRYILQLGGSLGSNCPSSLLCIQAHYSWVVFCRASTCGFRWVFYLAILYWEKLKKDLLSYKSFRQRIMALLVSWSRVNSATGSSSGHPSLCSASRHWDFWSWSWQRLNCRQQLNLSKAVSQGEKK